MKLIIAYIQPHKLGDVKQELYKEEVFKMSVTNALGCGQQRGYTETYRGVETEVNLLKKVRLEVAVNEGFVDRTTDAINPRRPHRLDRRRQDLHSGPAGVHPHPLRRARARRPSGSHPSVSVREGPGCCRDPLLVSGPPRVRTSASRGTRHARARSRRRASRRASARSPPAPSRRRASAINAGPSAGMACTWRSSSTCSRCSVRRNSA